MLGIGSQIQKTKIQEMSNQFHNSHVQTHHRKSISENTHHNSLQHKKDAASDNKKHENAKKIQTDSLQKDQAQAHMMQKKRDSMMLLDLSRKINAAKQPSNELQDKLNEKDQKLKGESLMKEYLEDDEPNVDKIQTVLPATILNPYGTFMKFWNLLMILLLVFTGIVLPPRLAFDEESGIDWFYADIFIDSLFITDILVNFNSAFEDFDGQLVYERKLIALNYLTGWFAIDVSSSFPAYMLTDPRMNSNSNSNQNQNQDQSQNSTDTSGGSQTGQQPAKGGNYNNVLRLSRLPRIYKLAKVFRVLKFMKAGAFQKILLFLKLNDEYTQIMKFSVITLLLIHTMGCFWYFLATFDDEENWVIAFGIQNSPIYVKYIASIYFVLYVLVTVGYGNILPQNQSEKIFVIIFMFFAVMMFSYIMGVLTFSFSKLNEKEMLVKEREVYFNELAAQYKFDIDMHEQLIQSVQTIVNSSTNKRLEYYQQEQIFTELPPSLQGDICKNIFEDILQTVEFLKNKPKDFLRKVFKKFKTNFLNPGDSLYMKGERSNLIYFIIKGRIVTSFNNSKGEQKSLVLVEGSYFGEVDIIFKRDRAGNALAEDRSEIWTIEKGEFISLLDEFELIKKEVINSAVEKDHFMFKTQDVPEQENEEQIKKNIKKSYKEINKNAKQIMLKKMNIEDNINFKEKELEDLLGTKHLLNQTKKALGIMSDSQGDRIKDIELEEVIQRAVRILKDNNQK